MNKKLLLALALIVLAIAGFFTVFGVEMLTGSTIRLTADDIKLIKHDADGDGMPDYWEEHFGLERGNPDDAGKVRPFVARYLIANGEAEWVNNANISEGLIVTLYRGVEMELFVGIDEAPKCSGEGEVCLFEGQNGTCKKGMCNFVSIGATIVDYDQDGLTNLEEYLVNSNPLVADSDLISFFKEIEARGLAISGWDDTTANIFYDDFEEVYWSQYNPCLNPVVYESWKEDIDRDGITWWDETESTGGPCISKRSIDGCGSSCNLYASGVDENYNRIADAWETSNTNNDDGLSYAEEYYYGVGANKYSLSESTHSGLVYNPTGDKYEYRVLNKDFIDHTCLGETAITGENFLNINKSVDIKYFHCNSDGNPRADYLDVASYSYSPEQYRVLVNNDYPNKCGALDKTFFDTSDVTGVSDSMSDIAYDVWSNPDPKVTQIITHKMGCECGFCECTKTTVKDAWGEQEYVWQLSGSCDSFKIWAAGDIIAENDEAGSTTCELRAAYGQSQAEWPTEVEGSHSTIDVCDFYEADGSGDKDDFLASATDCWMLSNANKISMTLEYEKSGMYAGEKDDYESTGALVTLCDINGNGLSDDWESYYFHHGATFENLFDDRTVELWGGTKRSIDGDSLGVVEEYEAGTNPYLADTDNDGIKDSAEISRDGTSNSATTFNVPVFGLAKSEHVPIISETVIRPSNDDWFRFYSNPYPQDTFTSLLTESTTTSDLITIIDLDKDSLPDWWEVKYFYTENMGEAYAIPPGSGKWGIDYMGPQYWLLYEDAHELLNTQNELLGRATFAESKYDDLDSFYVVDEGGVPTVYGVQPRKDTLGMILPNGDPDNDGITNLDEFHYATDPTKADTDGDRLSDRWEIDNMYKTASGHICFNPNDGWSLWKDEECAIGQPADEFFDCHTSIVNTPDGFCDIDGDEIINEDEAYLYEKYGIKINGTNNDTDGDGLLDGEELWYYFDHLQDLPGYDTWSTGSDEDIYLWLSWNNGTKGAQNGICDNDTDADSISDYEEVITFKTKPYNADSDNDGLGDKYEVAFQVVDPHQIDEYRGSTVYSKNLKMTAGALIDIIYMVLLGFRETDLSDEIPMEITFMNATDPDTDGDGILDGVEFFCCDSFPFSNDTDGDTLSDEIELNYTVIEFEEDEEEVLSPEEEAFLESIAEWFIEVEDGEDIGFIYEFACMLCEAKYGIGDSNCTYICTLAEAANASATNSQAKFTELKQGWMNKYKAVYCTDLTSPRDRDTDNDTLLDGWEYHNKVPAAGCWPEVADDEGYLTLESLDAAFSDYKTASTPIDLDPASKDTDSDGLNDSFELCIIHTNPTDNDTDGDGLPDYAEVNAELPDHIENETLQKWYDDCRYEDDCITDPTKADSDGDGLPDNKELEIGTNPNNEDTDDDEWTDGPEYYNFSSWSAEILVEEFEDKTFDEWIKAPAGDCVGHGPLCSDTDNDSVFGLEMSDWVEYDTYDTKPYSAHSDEDIMPDGWEVYYVLAPKANDANGDPDGDKLKNEGEYLAGTHPNTKNYLGASILNAKDYDVDTLFDGWEWKYQEWVRTEGPNLSITFDMCPIDVKNERHENKPNDIYSTEHDADCENPLDLKTKHNYSLNPCVCDTDEDGLPDWWMVKYFPEELLKDYSKGGAKEDILDIDTTAAMAADSVDVVEVATSPTMPGAGGKKPNYPVWDPDGDTISNMDEYKLSSIPSLPEGVDSDGDGMPDSWEIKYIENNTELDICGRIDTCVCDDSFETVWGCMNLTDVTDKDKDYDNDTVTNINEFSQSFNPVNPMLPPTVHLALTASRGIQPLETTITATITPPKYSSAPSDKVVFVYESETEATSNMTRTVIAEIEINGVPAMPNATVSVPYSYSYPGNYTVLALVMTKPQEDIARKWASANSEQIVVEKYVMAAGNDTDGDNVSDIYDNCPFDYNPVQQDGDGDKIGDICDSCPGTARGAVVYGTEQVKAGCVIPCVELGGVCCDECAAGADKPGYLCAEGKCCTKCSVATSSLWIWLAILLTVAALAGLIVVLWKTGMIEKIMGKIKGITRKKKEESSVFERY